MGGTARANTLRDSLGGGHRVSSNSSVGVGRGLRTNVAPPSEDSSAQLELAEAWRMLPSHYEDSLKLAAAVVRVRDHTMRVAEQEVRAAAECKKLEEELRQLAEARQDREAEAEAAIEHMTKVAEEAEEHLNARAAVELRHSGAQAGGNANVAASGLRALRKQVQLKDAAIRRLTMQCDLLKLELAAAAVSESIPHTRSEAPRSSASTLPEHSQLGFEELRRRLSQDREKHRSHIALLQRELRRRRSLHQQPSGRENESHPGGRDPPEGRAVAEEVAEGEEAMKDVAAAASLSWQWQAVEAEAAVGDPPA